MKPVVVEEKSAGRKGNSKQMSRIIVWASGADRHPTIGTAVAVCRASGSPESQWTETDVQLTVLVRSRRRLFDRQFQGSE